ncbi:MAG: tyrosine--tRNA ligase [Candidatus Komeilibacteria bacterium]|nr:tyrosine--tRNA ligase [Candidatus Komeilibacteria bacterium]
MIKKQDKVSELLTRGVEDVIVRSGLEKLLNSGKKLRVYLGIDPTSTRITLGNAVPLRKLRDFQNLGHEVIFLVGTFTALIGDTSDKEAMRKPMTLDEIKANFKTYKQQASKILDFSKAKIVYNGDWLAKLKFTDIVKLAQNFTVQQMIERDMYQKRLRDKKPIGLHEFLYPLMQGYDSVHMEVDVEIGGNDQLFNMLAGRTLLKIYKNKEKYVLTTPLIEGLDGRKMSKSYGNSIDITDDPNDMFGKIMSLKDDLIVKYFELCTDVAPSEIEAIKKDLADGQNPRDIKARLGREIVALYHGQKAAAVAEQEFAQVFSKHKRPTDIPVRKIENRKWKMDELLAELDLVSSKSEARRLAEQGGVKIDDRVLSDCKVEIEIKKGMVVQVGKRKFVKIA